MTASPHDRAAGSAKIIWISDLHFTHEGNILNHDPRVRLDAAIDHINTHHANADCCIISGDLVNRGTPLDYERLSGYLERLAVPFFPMVGNHDDRDLLRQTLPLPATGMPDFVQYTHPIPGGLIVCLDTQRTGADAGEFCDRRSAWLKGILTNAVGQSVYLFMHHPPHRLGLPIQDVDKMENGDAFLNLVSSFECVKHLFIGHVHRPICGTVRGLAFATMRSALYQAPPPVPKWDWGSFKPSKEAPSIGVITTTEGSVTLQYEQFCTYETGTGS